MKNTIKSVLGSYDESEGLQENIYATIIWPDFEVDEDSNVMEYHVGEGSRTERLSERTSPEHLGDMATVASGQLLKKREYKGKPIYAVRIQGDGEQSSEMALRDISLEGQPLANLASERPVPSAGGLWKEPANKKNSKVLRLQFGKILRRKRDD